MGFFTLGQSPLSGLELANVDATIMSEGVWCPPTPIKEVLDRNGNPVEVKEEPCEQAISKDLANSLAVGMSKDHVGGGTAARAAGAIGWTRPMIGKTGTSQDNASAAFVGATPQYAGAAMVFQPDAYPKSLCDGGPGLVYKSCGDPNMWGGGTPARTWFGAMKVIHEGLPVQQLPKAAKQYERAKK